MMSEKKVYLITGANSGIGFEVATQLLTDESTHVLLGARSKAKGEAAVTDLQSRNLAGSVEWLQIDVADENSVRNAARETEARHKKIDGIVNNAGIASAPGSTAEQLIECFRVNAVGAEIVVEQFLPLLRKSGETGRIVNVSTGGGSIGNRLNPEGIGYTMKVLPYRASKAAMNMVSACQFVDLQDEGIKVFTYGPGHTVSNLGSHNTAEYGAKPTSDGAAPIVSMLRGERDDDAGKFIEYGHENFPW